MGTGQIQWQQSQVAENNIQQRFQSISAMPQYAGKSHEELRFEDYVQTGKCQGQIGGAAGGTVTNLAAGGAFGATNTQAAGGGFSFGGGGANAAGGAGASGGFSFGGQQSNAQGGAGGLSFGGGSGGAGGFS